jgi:hypothetical protein
LTFFCTAEFVSAFFATHIFIVADAPARSGYSRRRTKASRRATRRPDERRSVDEDLECSR